MRSTFGRGGTVRWLDRGQRQLSAAHFAQGSGSACGSMARWEIVTVKQPISPRTATAVDAVADRFEFSLRWFLRRAGDEIQAQRRAVHRQRRTGVEHRRRPLQVHLHHVEAARQRAAAAVAGGVAIVSGRVVGDQFQRYVGFDSPPPGMLFRDVERMMVRGVLPNCDEFITRRPRHPSGGESTSTSR